MECHGAPARGVIPEADEVAMSAAVSSYSFPPDPPAFEVTGMNGADSAPSFECGEKGWLALGEANQTVPGTGSFLAQRLLEVLPLRSKSTGREPTSAMLPLPASRTVLTQLWPDTPEVVLSWVSCVCMSLNSFWGDTLHSDRKPSSGQRKALGFIKEDVDRFCKLRLPLEGVDWSQFFSVRGVDYKGDEVRVAKRIGWSNIAPALPKEIGVAPLEQVCTLGCREYVCSFDSFLKPREQWGRITQPKVMVSDSEWPRLCSGLVDAGVCCYIEEEMVFDTGQGPLLNGLFGVSKEEWTPDGTEICRLIMNMIPLNSLCESLSGHVDSLPSWGMMNPFFLQPGENLLISSEDVKCFFYTMKVPTAWVKFLAFNKRVPDSCLPDSLCTQSTWRQRCYLWGS